MTHINKKIMAVGLICLLISGITFANYYTGTVNENPNIIQFENSNWNYIKGYGFVDDHAVEVLEQQAFTENSRNYFLGEVN